jgi:hypothetical protein
MVVVQPVHQGDISLVPWIVPSLLAADQEDRRAPGVEGIQDAVRPTGMLHPELAHARVLINLRESGCDYVVDRLAPCQYLD